VSGEGSEIGINGEVCPKRLVEMLQQITKKRIDLLYFISGEFFRRLKPCKILRILRISYIRFQEKSGVLLSYISDNLCNYS
jgi:hypothetical protein